MKKLLTWLSKRRFPYEPLITVSVSGEAILHNLEEFRKLAPERQVAPVLKSNAYGHGLIEVAELLEGKAKNIPFFIVDSYFEAVTLRARGIKTPILIIGYTRPQTIRASTLKKVAFTITNLETLRDISDVKRPIHIHIKLDTGMRRQGLLQEEWSRAIEIPKHNPYIIVEGICSHLCDADNADPSFTEKQIKEWNSAVNLFSSQFPQMKFKHLSATDGHQFHKEITANLPRLGIGLYGITDNKAIGKVLDLKPALEMQTIITGIKKIKKGDVVGYGKTFTADRDMTVATIPVGYFEGLDRNLSNKGMVLVGSGRTPCPIVGRVSMNITTIDVSAADAHINDPVIAISRNKPDPNSIHGIVNVSNGRIPYEIVVRIPAHLKRVVI